MKLGAMLKGQVLEIYKHIQKGEKLNATKNKHKIKKIKGKK